MVIWFNNEKARKYLLENGDVYTLRPKKRREGLDVLSYTNFGKKGIVEIKFLGKIEDYCELQDFVEFSGFESIKEWKRAAGDSRFLYYVKLVEVG
jgi:hypothetical protein